MATAKGDVDIAVKLRGAREFIRDTSQVSRSIKGMSDTYVDSNGRLRDANGRFVKSSDDFRRSLRRVGAAAVVAGGALAAYAGVELKRSITQTMDFAKETIKLQDLLGGTAEDNSRLVAVFKSRGITTDNLFTATTRLSKAIIAAQQGTGNAAESFKAFGVSQEMIKRGSPVEILQAISDGFVELGPGALRTAKASELLGKGWAKLRPILKLGGKEIAAQVELAGQLGNKLTDKNLTDAGSFIKAQRTMQMAVSGLRTQIGIRLLPVLGKAATAFNEFITDVMSGDRNMSSLARSTRRVIRAVRRFTDEMKIGKGAGGDFAYTVRTIANGVKATAKFMKDLYDNSAVLRSLFKVLFRINIIVAFRDALQSVKNTINDIKSALSGSPGDILKRLLPNTGFGPGGRRGGRVTESGFNSFAGGGRVPGSRVMADTVPAMLSPGEFVVTRSGEAMLNSLTGIPGVLNHVGRAQRAHFGSGGRVAPMRTGALGSSRPIITKVYLDKRQIAEAVGSEFAGRQARR